MLTNIIRLIRKGEGEFRIPCAEYIPSRRSFVGIGTERGPLTTFQDPLRVQKPVDLDELGH
ncbi:MAG TPA: hypothetical protein VMU05_06385, partial [Dongiaceae bacterium]|nr:hypothetical protein [Dongiaceae bacterium]